VYRSPQPTRLARAPHPWRERPRFKKIFGSIASPTTYLVHRRSALSDEQRANHTQCQHVLSGTIDAGSVFLNGVGSTLTVTNSTLEINSDIHNFGSCAQRNNSDRQSPGGITGGGNCAPLFGSTLPVTDQGYNISDDDSCEFSATCSLNSTDLMLDPARVANNGGPTPTIALLMGSPAIDAIRLDSCTDQTGNPLTDDQVAFPDRMEGPCDIGAYEYQDFAGQPGTASCQGVSVSALTHQFRSIKAAASALRFPSVKALQAAITAFCRA
jgi:hypothetical protein